MKTFSKIIILLCVFALTSCQEDSNSEPQEIEQISNLLSSKRLTDENLITKLNNTIGDNMAGRVAESLDLSNVVVSEYENSNVMSITIPTNGGLTYTTYTKDGKVWQGSYFIEITTNDDLSYISYYDLSLIKFGELTIENGIIINALDLTSDSQSGRITGWWGDWSDCVGASFNKMTDGSVEGSLYGLACVAFGPECAAGIALGCAVGATFL